MKSESDIMKSLKKAWRSGTIQDRKISGWGGKGWIILFDKHVKEKFGGTWTNEDQKEAEESYKHGAYDINTLEYKGHYAEEGQPDGHYTGTYGNQTKYYIYQVINGWAPASLMKDITKQEFDGIINKKPL